MKLLNISHKIMVASALINTVVATLAFFFFVINEGGGLHFKT